MKQKTKGSFKKGHIVPLEWRIKISQKATGRKVSNETREKISEKNKGKKRSSETKKRLSLSKIGFKNPQWKGDKVGYSSLHEWIKTRLEKPKLCQKCNSGITYDLANKSNLYKRDLNDWWWLCRSCHMKIDGRINNLKQFQKGFDYKEMERRDKKILKMFGSIPVRQIAKQFNVSRGRVYQIVWLYRY